MQPRPPFRFILWVYISLITPAHASYTQFSDERGFCDIIGDSDVYGLGIRFDLYLQWIAVLFTTLFAPDQRTGSRIAANIINLAVLINTFHNAFEGSLIIVEWYIVTWLTFVLNIGNIPLNRIQVRKAAGSFATMLMLWSIVIFAQPWLYFKAVDMGSKDGYGAHILFAPISVYGRWATVGKAFPVIGCVFGVGVLFALVHIFLAGIEPVQPDDEVQENRGEAGWGSVFLFIFQALTGSTSNFQVEMTIRTDDIDLLASKFIDSGQLISFLIGFFTIVAVVDSSPSSRGWRNMPWLKKKGLAQFLERNLTCCVELEYRIPSRLTGLLEA